MPPATLPWCFVNTWWTRPPKDLCSNLTLCLGCSCPRNPHVSHPHLRQSISMATPLTTLFETATHYPTVASLILFFFFLIMGCSFHSICHLIQFNCLLYLSFIICFSMLNTMSRALDCFVCFLQRIKTGLNTKRQSRRSYNKFSEARKTMMPK